MRKNVRNLRAEGSPPEGWKWWREEYGKPLTEWLNGSLRNLGRRRVWRLLERMEALGQLRPQSDEAIKTLRRINLYFRRCLQRPVCLLATIQGANSHDQNVVALEFERAGEQTHKEHWAINTIFRLANRNLLSRVRLCEWNKCRKWFYASVEHQKFCSEGCRKSNERSSPEGKAQQRARSKRYYDALFADRKRKTTMTSTG
jgi:hypothetical protein